MLCRDRTLLRSALSGEPAWTLYALGDLAPDLFEHTEWHVAGETVILLYRAVTPPVLFASGDPSAIAALTADFDDARVYLHVRPEAAAALAPIYRDAGLRAMQRLVLNPARFRSEHCVDAVRLTAADAPALEALYADGRDTQESPDFFFPSMLNSGVFYGIREGAELIAAAGTHLVTAEEGVAAIGNVYTRRDRRNRGLAGALTSAVAEELLHRGIPTIGMNVIERNATALRVYTRLGFVLHCAYVEGPAERGHTESASRISYASVQPSGAPDRSSNQPATAAIEHDGPQMDTDAHR